MLALGAAAKNGNLVMVRCLLDAGATIQQQQNEGEECALVYAIKSGNIGVISLLLQAGADVENEYGETSLLEESLSVEPTNRMKIVQLLLDAGVDIDANGGTGTALITAAKENDIEMARFLIQAGADVNVVNLSKGMALQAASSLPSKNTVLIKFLLASSADVNGRPDRNFGGRTAL